MDVCYSLIEIIGHQMCVTLLEKLFDPKSVLLSSWIISGSANILGKRKNNSKSSSRHENRNLASVLHEEFLREPQNIKEKHDSLANLRFRGASGTLGCVTLLAQPRAKNHDTFLAN